MRFVDVKNDIAFRKIFGNENKSEIIISFIKNAPNLEVVPINVLDQGLKSAYQDAEKYTWTKDELMAYDYASMRKGDEKGKRKKAIEKAVSIAVAEAVTKTKEDEKLELAQRMVKAKEPIEKIKSYTGLSDETINILLRDMKK